MQFALKAKLATSRLSVALRVNMKLPHSRRVGLEGYGRGVRLGAREPCAAALALEEVFGGRVMNDAKAVRIASVKHAGECKLHLRWVNGKTMTVDLSEPVHRLKGLRTLRDGSIFARAERGEDGHSIVWPGEIDMGAARLWKMSLEQNEPS
jgi:hypothetical protein